MSDDVQVDTSAGDGGGAEGRGDAPGADAGGRRPRVAPFIVGIVAIVAAGLIWVLTGADATPQETAETPLIDRPAPNAVGELADGSTFDLSRRKGSWVVINFFQSSCVPCKQEHPELVDFVDEQRRLDAQSTEYAEFYTIVWDDDRPSVDKFFRQRGGDWPIVYDDDHSISTAFGVSKVPETWIISPDGFVRQRYISRITADALSSDIQAMREAGL